MNAILRFTVENFRSIAERKTITFIPDAIKDKPQDNIFTDGGISFLKTAAIYGANSSGKSNLLFAIELMERIVVSSVKINETDKLPYYPFLLSSDGTIGSTLYEMDFVTNGERYRYGFTNNEDMICDEWLVKIGKRGAEKYLFLRNEEGIGVNAKLFPEGKNLESRTNKNRLFLSLVGQLGGNISNTIIAFFRNGVNTLSGLETEEYTSFTGNMLHKHKPGTESMMNFFRRVQLGFTDLLTKTIEFDSKQLPSDMPAEMREMVMRELKGRMMVNVLSVHNVYNKEGDAESTRSFDFGEMESEGTKKLFDIAGPIFNILSRGGALIIDEIDAKMHPIISYEIVSLFNDPKRNPLGAQLIFTTHDTNLLSSNLLRRDQIWFTEKDAQERTDVYSLRQIVLPDGSKPRGDGNIERNYIKGRYGAIPYIQSVE